MLILNTWLYESHHRPYIWKQAIYLCRVVIYILLASCEKKQAPGCASNSSGFNSFSPHVGGLYVEALSMSELLGECDTENWSSEMITVNNLMAFSLVAGSRKLNTLFFFFFSFPQKWIQKQEARHRLPPGRTDHLNYIIYILCWKWFEFNLWHFAVLPDEINCVWHW